MTQDEIFDLAKKAGFMQHLGVIAIPNVLALERFITLVASIERERAALKVEELGMIGYGTLAIAAAIRKGDQE